MRAVSLGLVVFALGLATAALVASPRAGARTADGSLSGSVGPGFSISMSDSTVAAGSYTINVSDSATSHNFHFFGPGVDKKTSIAGTGSTSWSVTLAAGTYTFQCDAHASTMNGSLTVTDGTTTATDTTSTAASTSTAATTSTESTTTTHTTTRRTTTAQETTSEATTTEAAPTTTEAETTTTAPAATTEQATTVAATTTTVTTPAPKPLKAHVAAARATEHAVAITVASTLHGRAVARLFAGARQVAQARGAVPGKLVLHPAHALEPGRYTLKLRVTAGSRTTTSSRIITVA